MLEIEYIDPVACRLDRRHAKAIESAISFQRSYWQDTPKGKRQKFYDYIFWLHKGKKDCFFPTGLLPSVLSHCRENDIQVKVTGKRPESLIFKPPELSGINLRPDQMDAIKAALARKRGVIKAPTRTGKTILQYGICSCAPMNALFLGDKVNLVQQLAEEGRRFGFNTHELHGKQKDLHWDKKGSNVVCAVRATAANLFKKQENLWMSEFFNAVFVDEAHHVSTAEGQYAEILRFIKAPLRFGFTATPNHDEESKAAITAFLGPLIYDLTINDAIGKGLLVDPKIKLLKPPAKKIAVATKYADVYQQGIVENQARHELVAKTAMEFMEQGKSVLILVNRLDHGIYQQAAFEKFSNEREIPFLHGDTDPEEREIIKRDLINKKILCAIVTTIWKEGINIPTLDVCVNAAGGVSEISTLQGVGRSLTKSEGKEVAHIVDVFDQSHHYLIRHFGERVSLYMDNGWL